MTALKPLSDKIALVTGASRGIGAALALQLAEAGAHVVAVARTVGGLEELDDKIKAAGGTATLVPVDMKDMDGIARLALAIHDRYKRLDVMVGNAGILGPLSPLPRRRYATPTPSHARLAPPRSRGPGTSRYGEGRAASPQPWPSVPHRPSGAR